LTTDGFPFHSEANIQREIWKKAIINSVFNSICPLLEVDNGVFVRDEETANLAQEVVRECITLTDRLNMGLTEHELMEQILLISKRSDGQLISTLQDIRIGRPTEIEFLNLEIARVAASLQPRLELPKVEILGKMIVAKSLQQRRKEP
jgi:2-dehydropantoate 2-reductase